MNSFSIIEALSFGWRSTKRNIGFITGVFFAYIIFIVVSIFITDKYKYDGALLAFFIVLLLLLIQHFTIKVIKLIFTKNDDSDIKFRDLSIDYVFIIKVIRLIFTKYDGADMKFEELLANMQLTFKVLITNLLLIIIITIGMLLLVIPGIFLTVRFSFSIFLIIDKDIAIIESIKRSYRITKGNTWKLLLLLFPPSIINSLLPTITTFLSDKIVIYSLYILAFIGNIVTFFIMLFTMLYVYKKLSTLIETEPPRKTFVVKSTSTTPTQNITYADWTTNTQSKKFQLQEEQNNQTQSSTPNGSNSVRNSFSIRDRIAPKKCPQCKTENQIKALLSGEFVCEVCGKNWP
ncbi:MAG: hypothetical protein HQL06_11065 [Nitrospirae bacterium]|nr:hypothetical protein [Nitrospirota bacterium]